MYYAMLDHFTTEGKFQYSVCVDVMSNKVSAKDYFQDRLKDRIESDAEWLRIRIEDEYKTISSFTL